MDIMLSLIVCAIWATELIWARMDERRRADDD